MCFIHNFPKLRKFIVQFNVNLEGKTVLVTGAAGFIGSNLVKRLFHDVKNIKVIQVNVTGFAFHVMAGLAASYGCIELWTTVAGADNDRFLDYRA